MFSVFFHQYPRIFIGTLINPVVGIILTFPHQCNTTVFLQPNFVDSKSFFENRLGCCFRTAFRLEKCHRGMSTDPRLRKSAAVVSTPTGDSPAALASPARSSSAVASAAPGETADTANGAEAAATDEPVKNSTVVDAEMLEDGATVKAEPVEEGARLPFRLSSEQIESGMFDTPPPARLPAAPTASTSAHPVAAAPLSRVAQLLKRIESNPLDGEARLALIVDAESKGDLERTREIYEDFLTVFPDAVRFFPLSFAIRKLTRYDSRLNGSPTPLSSYLTPTFRSSKPSSLVVSFHLPPSRSGSSTSTTSAE